MARPRKDVSVVRTFLGPRILTLEQLCERLQLSRATVIRRLNEHGHFSSYNWSGMFLTIGEVAEFDQRGLWVCKGARFSSYGNLKETVEHFVHSSERGMTHGELATILGVRAHNTLLELVREGPVIRERIGPAFVYVSRKRTVQRKQVRLREAFLREHEKPRPTSRQKIATLLELVKDPNLTRQDIVRRCKRGGVEISSKVVDAIFDAYDLDKKKAR